MSCFETETVVELAPREVITLPEIRGATLRVTRGTLWVTQHGSPQDVVLRTGDNWMVERNGDTVVEAQRDSIFRVVTRRGIAGHRLAVARPPRRDLAASLRHILGPRGRPQQ